jgi:phenylpropionate dioxygenase-like ring-hydroxylating dioxygenase large terminal subunit
MEFPAMNDDLRERLQALASRPDDAPWAMDGRFYTDAGLFAHERASFLRAGWHCLGRADEVPQDGDFFTTILLDEPLIVTRHDGQLRVLSNVCRHRGMPVAKGQGNTKRFVCPYHAWTYGTDGTLLRAARMVNADFDPKTCALPGFACAERFGFIYVSLSEAPVDLDIELAGLGALVGPYQPDGFRIVHADQGVWRTNWKCLIENFMEGYHLSVVHPQTLHGYTPTGLSKKAASGPGFTSYFANYPQGIPLRGSGAPGLDPAAQHRSTLFAVFPCQVVSQAASLLVSLSLRPVAVDATDVRWTMSVYGEDLDAATVTDRIRLWEDVNREDREKLEEMQAALSSRHATGGPLAGPDYEGTVHDFLKWQARMDVAG